MSGRLQGKKALITGAAGGLGRAMAHMMAREGAMVALTDLDEAAVEALAKAVNDAHPGRALSFPHDVTDEARWAEVVGQAAEAMGGLSVLVNNAGIGAMARVEDQSLEEWRRVMAIDLDSVMLGCKHALPHLKASQPASIVNISSIAGLAAAPGLGAYNAAKAGVWLFTKAVALECAKDGVDVRANSVHPCFIRTPILDPFVAMAGGDETTAHQKLSRGIPLGRIGEPDDVAYAVVYLASDESRFVTGAELKIDGGLTAQ
ncbi:SDR family oxidoreductase [Brevundimonas sp. 2R-24]|uniref:SDR family oxidoreductase n=1 Tax=Peiella sedimenti TaxID=3061083 RepID=A0ABT8SL70_9CAUL|nr:SDR family oxidoreductase [Caulobacteraceae bacterium XZ-24]